MTNAANATEKYRLKIYFPSLLPDKAWSVIFNF